MDFLGTSGRDNYVGTALADTFDMSQGGRDTVSGLEGDDTFIFGTELNANDQVDGGAGADIVELEGNYLGGLVLLPSTLVNIEKLVLKDGFNYTLTIDDATATGVSFIVDAHLLGASDVLVFDGSAETGALLDVEGGAGDDVLIGGQHANRWFLGEGGADTVTGGPTSDTFFVEAALDAGDRLDGGLGIDIVSIAGPYAGLELTGAMLIGMELIQLSPIFDISLVLRDEVTAAGLVFRVTVPGSGGGGDLVVDGSAETDAVLDFEGARSDDTFIGGALADIFDFRSPSVGDQGGVDVVEGNEGDDTILFDEKFTRDDQVDGGGGFDVLELEGDYSAGVDFGSGTMSDVEQIVVAAGFDYGLIVGDNNIRADGFILDGELLGASDDLDFDAGAESASDLILRGGAGQDGLFAGEGDDSLVGNAGADLLNGGAGDDTIQGGGGGDGFYGGAGADRFDAGAGVDYFVYFGAAESTGPGYDHVGQLKPLKDKFDMEVPVVGVDPRVNGGALSTATFDLDLAAEIDALALAAHHAVVFKPSAGDLAGHIFLIVDANGADGYQAGEDYVMEMAAGSQPNAIAVGFFV